MAILIFVLSLVLLVAGAASGYQSLDLLPDTMGVLYALAGAVGVAAAVVTFAIGVAILRIDALVTRAMRKIQLHGLPQAIVHDHALKPLAGEIVDDLSRRGA